MKVFYCAGTHWDREWYESFQEFRMWLVDLLDNLIDLMEKNPEYKSFHLDGQTVVIEDYLEIRPEKREKLIALAKEGRLIFGPWYNLPDEWLISGESFIRNLMRGIQICKDLDIEPMSFAYTPDQFGHIAALPMIMNGFGFKAGIVWRGTQNETIPAFFNWVGPDGKSMPYFKLDDTGSYGPFKFLVRDKIKEEGLSKESYEKYFKPYLEREKQRASIPLMLMLDALDHDQPDLDMPRILNDLKSYYPDVEFIWASLSDFAEEVRCNSEKFPDHKGEFRQPCRDISREFQYLIVHTISSRYPIKRRNGQCQAILEKWAEPYTLFHSLSGGKPIMRYLDKSWEYLLKNHPHDSICGCSIDQVHRDMLYRFDQCEMLADGIVKRAITDIGKVNHEDKSLHNIVVHNPLAFTRKGIAELNVIFPSDWGKTFRDGIVSGETVNKFHLIKKNGERVPYQIIRIERGKEHKIPAKNNRVHTRTGDNIYHLAVDIEIPPCGYTAFQVQPTDETTRTFGSLMNGPLSASTGLISFSLNSDGTAVLKHHASGKKFNNMFIYEDCGDSGDGWTMGRLSKDMIIRTPGTIVTTAIDEEGPLRIVFRIEREFNLPARVDWHTSQRSDDCVKMRVIDYIYVEKNAPYIRVRTKINNTAMDHRFRVLFSTNINSDVSFAETPFAIVERPVLIPEETAKWHERINPESPFSSFCGIKDNEGGLALLAPFGPHEYEITQTHERTLALTLFRSTFKTVGTSGEPDGQLLHPMEFEYLLYPFKGMMNTAEILRLTAEAQAAIKTNMTDTLPDDHSFLQLKNPNIVLTALKSTNNQTGGIIRLWNTTDKNQKEEIQLDRKIKSAHTCNLNEEFINQLSLNKNGEIFVSVPPYSLVTVHFEW